MKMTFFWKQQILFFFVLAIAAALVRYFWNEIEGGNSVVALFIRGFIGGAIGIVIIRFVNLKKNNALNDPQ